MNAIWAASSLVDTLSESTTWKFKIHKMKEVIYGYLLNLHLRSINLDPHMEIWYV